MIAQALLTLMLMPTAEAATINLVGNSSSESNCIPFGENYQNNTTNPLYSGFVYQNVPAFELSPGDTLAFDLYQE